MSRVGYWVGVLLFPLAVSAVEPVQPEPVRMVVECEDMQGVAPDAYGPGPGWQTGRWGHDLYANMTFGGPFASRLRTAMTDAGENAAEATAEIDVPAAGTYKVWVKYERPPFFNYAFGIKIEPLSGKGAVVFEKTYGLLATDARFFSKKDPRAGGYYWNWGFDHDAAEGYEARLAKGRYRLTLFKAKNPEPGAARSVDSILITSDLSDSSAPGFPRFPLLDELRRANHVYFRFRNPARAKQPIFIAWNHWNHRYPDFYTPGGAYRQLVRFYDEQGWQLAGGQAGDWLEGIAPGAVSPWYDLGPTMNTESTSPFQFVAYAPGTKAVMAGPSLPFTVDLALEPNQKKIVKSFTLESGEPALTVLVQPDLHRPEGVALTRKASEIYAELTRELNRKPRLGPLAKKLRLFGNVGTPYGGAAETDVSLALREALGLNTLPGNDTRGAQILASGRHDGIIERSLAYHHSQDPPQIVKWVREHGAEKLVRYLSFGDEIDPPEIDLKDPLKTEAFREFLRKRGETPETLGAAAWDQVAPLAALPEEAVRREGQKRLYWHSLAFSTEQGIAVFAEKTRTLKAALGDEVQTTANLGGMHPYYWMQQPLFIELFKGGGLSLAWTEDYTYCMPEASRLVADFQAATLRKGASYHDTPMQWYCMAHWPGNNPEQVIQNAVLEWGQNVKDLNFYDLGPDLWSTENYVAYRGGLPTLKAVRTLTGMAGLIENDLLPARTEPARIAMVLSEASDVWETEGKGMHAVRLGSAISNVSQEERKAIWYALRYAGYRVEQLTEQDCADGLLKNYSAAYLCGQNLEHQAAAAVKEWVNAGGTVFATAGAARKDEADAPSAALDEVLGRGQAVAYERYKGPLRARLELLFVKALDEMKLADGKALPVFCSREEFGMASNAQVLATYKNGKAAMIVNDFGKGRAYYTGTLPGQSWVKAALPVAPHGRGGPHTLPHMREWLEWDPVAADVILTPVRQAKIEPDVVANRRGVVVNRLASDKSTVLTVVNLALEADGELNDVELRVSVTRPVKRAWSCFYPKGTLLKSQDKGVAVIRLPALGPADVVVLEP